MSYYYSFFLGYMMPDQKIYPLGPFEYQGCMYPVFCKSRSFISELPQRFDRMRPEQCTEELRKAIFSTGNYEDDYFENCTDAVRYLPADELPDENIIRSGYFLIDEVKEFIESQTPEVFSDCLTPEIYHAKAANELQFGKPAARTDEYGETYQPYSAADYMKFSYADYWGEDYEVHRLKLALEMFDEYDLPKGSRLVILETEG